MEKVTRMADVSPGRIAELIRTIPARANRPTANRMLGAVQNLTGAQMAAFMGGLHSIKARVKDRPALDYDDRDTHWVRMFGLAELEHVFRNLQVADRDSVFIPSSRLVIYEFADPKTPGSAAGLSTVAARPVRNRLVGQHFFTYTQAGDCDNWTWYGPYPTRLEALSAAFQPVDTGGPPDSDSVWVGRGEPLSLALNPDVVLEALFEHLYNRPGVPTDQFKTWCNAVRDGLNSEDSGRPDCLDADIADAVGQAVERWLSDRDLPAPRCAVGWVERVTPESYLAYQRELACRST